MAGVRLVLLWSTAVLWLTCASAAPVFNVSRSNWMRDLMPVIGHSTLLDLSLPGTHDSYVVTLQRWLTYDLSDTISDDTNDLSPVIAWLLHEFHDLFGVGKVIRNQSITQGLNLTETLDGGVRFIDFRITYTAGPSTSSDGPHDWYGLHFMETNQKALTYLEGVRTWLDEHPEEVVVMWVSRHGDECNTSYPDVTPQQKLTFWQSVEKLFSGLLLDTRVSSVNETTVSQLVERNHRMVLYLSDNRTFTGNSPLHINGCYIDNQLAPSADNTTDMLNWMTNKFSNMSTIVKNNAPLNKFVLISLSGGAPDSQVLDAFLLHYQPFGHKRIDGSCALKYHVPNMTTWCPGHLMDDGLLTNYYAQIMLDQVVHNASLRFPNAFYIDAVDVDGTIRTGPSVFGQYYGDDPSQSWPHATARYGYTDALLFANARLACSKPQPPAACATALPALQAKLQQYPLQVWNDPLHGRLAHWPCQNATGYWLNATTTPTGCLAVK